MVLAPKLVVAIGVRVQLPSNLLGEGLRRVAGVNQVGDVGQPTEISFQGVWHSVGWSRQPKVGEDGVKRLEVGHTGALPVYVAWARHHKDAMGKLVDPAGKIGP